MSPSDDTVTFLVSVKVAERLHKPVEYKYKASDILRVRPGAHSRQSILVLSDGTFETVGHSVEYVEECLNKVKPVTTGEKIIEALEEVVNVSQPVVGDSEESKSVEKPVSDPKVVPAKKPRKRKAAPKVVRKNRKRPQPKNVRNKKRAKPKRGSRGANKSRSRKSKR